MWNYDNTVMLNIKNDAAVLKKQNEENERLYELKVRTKNCCCRYCGGELKLRRILYGNVKEGRVEIFCNECNRIEYGVNKEIYHVAKYFEDEFQINLLVRIQFLLRLNRSFFILLFSYTMRILLAFFTL